MQVSVKPMFQLLTCEVLTIFRDHRITIVSKFMSLENWNHSLPLTTLTFPFLFLFKNSGPVNNHYLDIQTCLKTRIYQGW
jgi:hypothetical protein